MQELRGPRQDGEGDVPRALGGVRGAVACGPSARGVAAAGRAVRGAGAEATRVLRAAQVQGRRQGRQAAEDRVAWEAGRAERCQERYQGVGAVRGALGLRGLFSRGGGLESVPLWLRPESRALRLHAPRRQPAGGLIPPCSHLTSDSCQTIWRRHV